jgi:hypothetical protein
LILKKTSEIDWSLLSCSQQAKQTGSLPHHRLVVFCEAASVCRNQPARGEFVRHIDEIVIDVPS